MALKKLFIGNADVDKRTVTRITKIQVVSPSLSKRSEMEVFLAALDDADEQRQSWRDLKAFQRHLIVEENV